MEQALRDVIADEQVAITPVDPPTPSPPSPLTPEIMSAIESTTESLWPGVPVIPSMSTSATDGLFLRNAGIPVYGVSGVFYDVDDNRAHGQNERIRAQSYYDALEFLYRLTKQLASQ